MNKARGKSGPLFSFDVHDDVRLLADATKEKDESHAGKVVERSWYQRNKHIFPASRWEVRKILALPVNKQLIQRCPRRSSIQKRTMENIRLHEMYAIQYTLLLCTHERIAVSQLQNDRAFAAPKSVG